MHKNCPICGAKKSNFERKLNGIDLLKCCYCEFVFANISNEKIEAINSSYSERTSLTYEKQQTFFDGLWFRNIAKKFTQKFGPGKVLDVGCGNGLLLKYFIEYGWDCYGVDLSPWSKKYSDIYGFNLIQGKIEDLKLKESSFDLIVSTSTLEHIAQPIIHIHEIIKLTKPNGIVYLAGIPNYSSISILFNFSSFCSNMPPGHVNYFTPSTMLKLVKALKCPIKRVSIKTYGIPEMHKIYKMINRRIANGEKRSKQKNISQFSVHKKINHEVLKKIIASLLINIYYYCGRFFSIGDKIEVVIVK